MVTTFTLKNVSKILTVNITGFIKWMHKIPILLKDNNKNKESKTNACQKNIKAQVNKVHFINVHSHLPVSMCLLRSTTITVNQRNFNTEKSYKLKSKTHCNKSNTFITVHKKISISYRIISISKMSYQNKSQNRSLMP